MVGKWELIDVVLLFSRSWEKGSRRSYWCDRVIVQRGEAYMYPVSLHCFVHQYLETLNLILNFICNG